MGVTDIEKFTNTLPEGLTDTYNYQDNQQSETNPACSGTAANAGCRDAT